MRRDNQIAALPAASLGQLKQSICIHYGQLAGLLNSFEQRFTPRRSTKTRYTNKSARSMAPFANSLCASTTITSGMRATMALGA